MLRVFCVGVTVGTLACLPVLRFDPADPDAIPAHHVEVESLLYSGMPHSEALEQLDVYAGFPRFVNARYGILCYLSRRLPGSVVVLRVESHLSDVDRVAEWRFEERQPGDNLFVPLHRQASEDADDE